MGRGDEKIYAENGKRNKKICVIHIGEEICGRKNAEISGRIGTLGKLNENNSTIEKQTKRTKGQSVALIVHPLWRLHISGIWSLEASEKA